MEKGNRLNHRCYTSAAGLIKPMEPSATANVGELGRSVKPLLRLSRFESYVVDKLQFIKSDSKIVIMDKVTRLCNIKTCLPARVVATLLWAAGFVCVFLAIPKI